MVNGLLGGSAQPQAAAERCWAAIDERMHSAATASMPTDSGRGKTGAPWWKFGPGDHLDELKASYRAAVNWSNHHPGAEGRARLAAAKTVFHKAIAGAKARLWEDTCSKVEGARDSAGTFFKLLRSRPQSSSLPKVPGLGVMAASPSARLDSVALHLSREWFQPAPADAAFGGMQEDALRLGQAIDAVQAAGVISFSEAEYDAATLSLSRKLNTMPGSDGLCAALFVKGGSDVRAALLALFRHMATHGVWPAKFKVAKAFLLCKPGASDLSALASYRTIMVCSVASRLYEKMLSPRLTSQLRPDFLSRWQVAFTAGRSGYEHVGRVTVKS